MTDRAYTRTMLAALSMEAKKSSRRRKHHNLHDNYNEVTQRLLNAIEPDSYIRPHRHSIDPKPELLIAVSGALTLVLFDDHGAITKVIPFSSEFSKCETFAVEISSRTWHTVIANTFDAVVLEIKSGPFLPDAAKDYAIWAPEESSSSSEKYFNNLCMLVDAAIAKLNSL